jgi:hypothetical protein
VDAGRKLPKESVTIRQRCARAYATACVIEFPLVIAFSRIGNKQNYDAWQRAVVLFHSVSFGILSVLTQWFESPTGNSLFDSHPNLYLFFFLAALFLLQSILLAATIVLLQTFYEVLRGLIR